MNMKKFWKYTKSDPKEYIFKVYKKISLESSTPFGTSITGKFGVGNMLLKGTLMMN